jgi:hypothetical protein
MPEKQDMSPKGDTWTQLRDKLEAAGLNASDALYLEAALTGGDEQLNYPDVAVRLRKVLEDAGWHRQ